MLLELMPLVSFYFLNRDTRNHYRDTRNLYIIFMTLMCDLNYICALALTWMVFIFKHKREIP